MSKVVKRALLCLLGGAGAAFMMYPTLEDWPLVVTVVLTAAVYGPTGYIVRRAVKGGMWYSGVLILLPLCLLLISWGFEALRSRPLILAIALISAYAGTWIGGRAGRSENKVGPTTPGERRDYSERGRAE